MTAIQSGTPGAAGSLEPTDLDSPRSTDEAPVLLETVAWPAPRAPGLRYAASVAFGVAAAWFLLFTVVLSGFQEHGSQARLYGQFRSELANETGPAGAPINLGQPVALLSIPRIGINRAVVVEGSTSRQLLYGPGHKADTPLPGQVGDSEVLGRALAYGGAFSAITSLRRGDKILMTTAQGDFTYEVTGTRRSSSPPPVKATQAVLTLVTAGGGWLGRLTPTRAVYVDARLIKGAAQLVPAPLPTVGSTSLPMAGNPNALVPLIFWLEGMVVVGAALAVAWRRWGRWQTWVVGLPLLMGVAWGTSQSLIQFLPNLV